MISLVLPSIYGRGKEVRYDEFKDTGYRPPELGDNGKPPYQIVFDHDFESKIIRVLMPGFAVNGTYFVIVENDNDKASLKNHLLKLTQNIVYETNSMFHQKHFKLIISPCILI